MSLRTSPLIPAVIGFLVIVTFTLGWGLFRKSQLDESSQQLAISVTQAIFVENNIDALIESAHPSLIEQYSVENLRRTLLSVSEIIGPLELIESISGSSNVSLIPFLGGSPTASYAINTSFNENIAPIIIEMVMEETQWQFTAYRVDSPLLLN